jgi:type VI secretion system secreted protein VgrG
VAIARTVTVAGSHDERVGAVQTVTVGGAQDVRVGAASVVTVGAAAALNVGGGYAINVGGALNQLVVGVKSTEIGGASLEAVGAHREERVVGDKESSVGAGAVADVDGAVRMATDRDVTETFAGKVTIQVVDVAQTDPEQGTLEATGSLKLVVGDTVVLAMTSGGEVQLAGTNVTLDGAELAAKGGSLKKIASGSARAARIEAQALEDLSTAIAIVELDLVDDGGFAVGNERVKVEFSDGTVREVRSDADGRVKVPGPAKGTAKVTLPDRDRTEE